MANGFIPDGNILNAKIVIDDENIVMNIYRIIEMYIDNKYNMNNDAHKGLQNIMYDLKTYDKIEEIIKEILEDVEYIPELKKD